MSCKVHVVAKEDGSYQRKCRQTGERKNGAGSSVNYGGGCQRLYTSVAGTHMLFCLFAGLAKNRNVILNDLMKI